MSSLRILSRVESANFPVWASSTSNLYVFQYQFVMYLMVLATWYQLSLITIPIISSNQQAVQNGKQGNALSVSKVLKDNVMEIVCLVLNYKPTKTRKIEKKTLKIVFRG